MVGRNYKKEYSNYQGTAEQKKKRASRNAARNTLAKTGRDGMDVDHKNGNPHDNSKANLRVKTKNANRSFPRNSKAGKK
jgi:hypothetical protein